MGHASRDKARLLNRVRRLRGQLDGVARSIEADAGCDVVLMSLAACRGAMGSLLAEVLEGHLNEHVASDPRPKARQRAAAELMKAVRSYVR